MTTTKITVRSYGSSYIIALGCQRFQQIPIFGKKKMARLYSKQFAV